MDYKTLASLPLKRLQKPFWWVSLPDMKEPEIYRVHLQTVTTAVFGHLPAGGRLFETIENPTIGEFREDLERLCLTRPEAVELKWTLLRTWPARLRLMAQEMAAEACRMQVDASSIERRLKRAGQEVKDDSEEAAFCRRAAHALQVERQLRRLRKEHPDVKPEE